MNEMTQIATAVGSISMDHTLVYLSYAIIVLVLFKDPLTMLGAKLFRIKTAKDKEDFLREDLRNHEVACQEINQRVLVAITELQTAVARIEGKLSVPWQDRKNTTQQGG